MKWTFREPESGDMIRVKSGSIYHFGIFASENEVIQFGLAPQSRPALKDCDVEVCSSDIDAFLNGAFLEVASLDKKEQKTRRKPAETVAYARSRIGEKGYNIIYNNCEHFAYECVFGKKYSEQTENVRELFRNIPVLDVYIAEIPDGPKIKPVHPKDRQNEINGCKNEGVKRQKYFVWKLLEYALERTFGYKIKKLKITKANNGKWVCPECEFSLSHSDGAVCVAISRKAVGVDIERIKTHRQGLAEKILTANEYAVYSSLPESEKDYFLLEKWTQKESIFKKSGGEFIPSKIDSSVSRVCSQKVCVGGGEYILSVASEDLESMRIVNDVSLKI